MKQLAAHLQMVFPLNHIGGIAQDANKELASNLNKMREDSSQANKVWIRLREKNTRLEVGSDERDTVGTSFSKASTSEVDPLNDDNIQDLFKTANDQQRDTINTVRNYLAALESRARNPSRFSAAPDPPLMYIQGGPGSGMCVSSALNQRLIRILNHR